MHLSDLFLYSYREVRERVKEIHVELAKTFRGEDRHLDLITQVRVAACMLDVDTGQANLLTVTLSLQLYFHKRPLAFHRSTRF